MSQTSLLVSISCSCPTNHTQSRCDDAETSLGNIDLTRRAKSFEQYCSQPPGEGLNSGFTSGALGFQLIVQISVQFQVTTQSPLSNHTAAQLFPSQSPPPSSALPHSGWTFNLLLRNSAAPPGHRIDWRQSALYRTPFLFLPSCRSRWAKKVRLLHAPAGLSGSVGSFEKWGRIRPGYLQSKNTFFLEDES